MDFSCIDSDLQNLDLMASDSLVPPTLFEGSEQHVDPGQTLIGGAEAVITESTLSHQYRALPSENSHDMQPTSFNYMSSMQQKFTHDAQYGICPLSIELPQAEGQMFANETRHGILMIEPPTMASESGRRADDSVQRLPPIRHIGPVMRNPITTLPPRRQGKRKGPLTEKSRESNRKTRLLGICIPCRFDKKKCGGGDPCERCVKLMSLEPKICPKPCVKAQFLDIIETGSIFPAPAIIEVAVLRQLTQNDIKSLRSSNLVLDLGISKPAFHEDKLPQGFTLHALELTFGHRREVEHQWSGFRSSRLISGFHKLFIGGHHPPVDGQLADYVLRFCSCRMNENLLLPELSRFERNTSPEGLLQSRLRWQQHQICTYFKARYYELCIFRYLQEFANDWMERTIAEKKTYLLCLIYILCRVRSLTATSFTQVELDENSAIGREISRDFASRQARVRSALWVYTSIAIQSGDLLQPWLMILQEHPHVSAHKMSSDLNGNLKDFEEGMLRITSPAEEALGRWVDYTTAFSTLANPSWDGVLGLMSLHYDSTLQSLSTEEVDNERKGLDVYFTYGFLTGDESKTNVPAILPFQPLALTDWQHCFIDSRDVQTDSENPGMSLCEIVLKRLNDIQNYLFTVNSVEAHGLHSPNQRLDSPETPFLAMNGMEDGDMNTDDASLASYSICRGRRWHELQRLLGPEVILLENGWAQHEDDFEGHLSIPNIVETGSERCFSALKEIIPSRLNWLAKTCKELSGVLDLIIQLKEMHEDDCRESIENRLTAIIVGAFGERWWVVRAISAAIEVRVDVRDVFEAGSSE